MLQVDASWLRGFREERSIPNRLNLFTQQPDMSDV
jgi:hypothetical protein